MAKKQRQRAAATADKYALYHEAVQDTESDITLAERVFKQQYGRLPRLLREDFSGTSLMACDWVARHEDNHAWAIDLDPEPLAWGREQNLAKLGDTVDLRMTRPLSKNKRWRLLAVVSSKEKSGTAS